MRSTVILALIISTMTFLVSCSPYGQPTLSASARTSKNPGSPSSQKTADSGGANTFMGKRLEFYKINPRNLEAYKVSIEPWLDSQAIKGTDIANALTQVLDKKIWYMIPSELKALSPEKIGSAVGADLDQAALQDVKQVWMNKLSFDKMNPEDQALLLTHELLMGLRLFKADSQLTPTDYTQIRTAAALITEKGVKINLQELEQILDSQGFIKISVKDRQTF